MITCPHCNTKFTINEMIEQWGYDVGDFQPDIVSDFVPTAPEPEWDWEEFFVSLENDKWFNYIDRSLGFEEEYKFNSNDLPFPIGSVGSS